MGKVKILVIGGTGYIGRKLIDKLLSMKDSFIIHSTYYSNRVEFRENVYYFKCDLTDIDSIKNTLTDDYDYVINLSGYVNHSLFSEGGISVINTHLIGLLNLTGILSRKNLKKFVHIGTSDEYGDNLNYKYEINRENPISPYSFSKTASSYFLQMLRNSENFPAIVLRLFLVYGPEQDENRFIPYLIKNCIKNNNVNLTECNQVRDFTYIDDIVNGILLATFSPEKLDENIVFNLASGSPIKLKELAMLIQKKIGSGNLIFGSKPYRNNESMHLVADINKFKSKFNWSPEIGIEVGIDMAIKSFLYS